jgi:hypothetical protein
MKTTRSAMATLLGFAMLAMPLTASAHTHHDDYRGSRPFQAYRPVAPAVNARPNFRMAAPFAPNRYFAPPARFAATGPRGYYGYNPAPTAYAPAPVAYGPPPMATCPISAPYSSYAPAYPPAYLQQPYYGAMPPAYGAMPYNSYGAMPNGLASMLHQRDSAEYLYRLAMQRGNYDRAHHLGNDINQLNKNIANARWHSGVGPAYGNLNPNPMTMNRAGYGYTSPLATNYGGGYGYNNYSAGYPNSGLGSMLGPVLGGFIH